MSAQQFNQAVLEAQGVSPSLAHTIAENFAQAERDLAAAQTHLRRIVEAAKFYALQPELYEAIQAAKEELNK